MRVLSFGNMEKDMESINFEQMLIEQIEVIDELLTKTKVPFSLRPLQVAIIFVEECIVDIKGDSKDNYGEKAWFAHIYSKSEEWYKNKYGDLLKHKPPILSGVVHLFGTPCSIKIPLTKTEPAEEERIWLVFPKEVLSDEDPLSWLEVKPNLNNIPDSELSILREEISFVATSLRKITNDIRNSDFVENDEKMLGTSVISHLEKASTDILSQKKEQLSIGFWELHLAIEKIIKAYLIQKGEAPPKTHDLLQLRELADRIIESNELDKPFLLCPSADDAIKYRYGENESINVNELLDFYNATLEIVAFYSGKIGRRKLVMNNAKFLIQSPPWSNKTKG